MPALPLKFSTLIFTRMGTGNERNYEQNVNKIIWHKFNSNFRVMEGTRDMYPKEMILAKMLKRFELHKNDGILENFELHDLQEDNIEKCRRSPFNV